MFPEDGEAGLISAESVDYLLHHVNSMLYCHLVSQPSFAAPGGLHPMEATAALAKVSPILQRLAGVYVGQEVRMAKMLAYDVNRVFDSVFGWSDVGEAGEEGQVFDGGDEEEEEEE